MTNITLENTKLKNYLDGKTNVIPEEEMLAIFEAKSKSGTFLETLDIQLVQGTMNAIHLGVPVDEQYVTDRFFTLASVDVKRRSGVQKEEWVPLAAKTFKELWIYAKKLNALKRR